MGGGAGTLSRRRGISCEALTPLKETLIVLGSTGNSTGSTLVGSDTRRSAATSTESMWLKV